MNCNCIRCKPRLNIITANNRVISEPDVVILPIINMVIGEQFILRIICISASLIKLILKQNTIFLNCASYMTVIRAERVFRRLLKYSLISFNQIRVV